MPETLEAIIHFLDQHALGIQALAALITLLLTPILAWATWRYVQPHQEWTTRLPLTSLSNRTVEFRANYESLSGTKYETQMRIESGVIVSFSFGPAASSRT